MYQNQLKEMLHYCPQTGVFSWIKARQKIHVGQIAGSDKGDGYRRIKIDGKNYSAHRLAWLYVHGVWPAKCVDHINRQPADNRIENLRCVDWRENAQNLSLAKNNSSGFRGVYFETKTKRWKVQLRANRKNYFLGRYENLADAANAYAQAATKYHTHNSTAQS